MDGGGRLAWSLRLRRFASDLVAASIGVGILTREWLERRRAAQKLRPAPRPVPSNRYLALLEKYLPRRIGVVATVLILVGSVGLGVVKGGHLEDFIEAASDARNAVANTAGFRITAVAVAGRKQLTHDEVLAIGGVNGRSSLLFLDAVAVREKLKANPWIAEANVLKLYPGELRIDITERTAFARWQINGRISVIADDGAVLEPYVARRFATLPLLVGKGADTHGRDFIALLAKYPQVKSVTRAAIYVGERRWNLRLTNGLDIRLPENDIGNALASLTKYDAEDKLLSRDIVAVDMRLPDRLTVRLSEDAAKAREELFKDKKPKKKAGDA
jgi:cell division protein FtsQ